MNEISVKILGATYYVCYNELDSEKEVEQLNGGCCDYTSKVINIYTCDKIKLGDTEEYYSHVLKRELIRAFLYESGIDKPLNKEFYADWIAIQLDKIYKAYKTIVEAR